MCDDGEEVVIILKTAALSDGSEAAVVILAVIRCAEAFNVQMWNGGYGMDQIFPKGVPCRVYAQPI